MYLFIGASVVTFAYQLYKLLPSCGSRVQYGTFDNVEQSITLHGSMYPLQRRLFARRAAYLYGKPAVKEWIREQFRIFRWQLVYYKLSNAWYKKTICECIVLPLLSMIEAVTGTPQLPTMLRLSYVLYMKRVLKTSTYETLLPLLNSEIANNLIKSGWVPHPEWEARTQGRMVCALKQSIPFQICLKSKLQF